MKNILFILILLLSLVSSSQTKAEKIILKDITNNIIQTQQIPVTITIHSIKDLRVKESQIIRMGQTLALRPLEPETPQGYISKSYTREVEEQKTKIQKIKQIVNEEKLPEIIIKHEEAKLKDLEFKAKEFQLGAITPRAYRETTYKSPVNGIVKRIIPVGGSDGKLNIEILIETNSR